MPFKGDMRLGGPHDNEASLNGTSSDFQSVPAYGTLLSGPTDTSRYLTDAVNAQFWMPYSTSVYADGLGGSYSVETWGLQYLPAGWVTSVTYNPVYMSWNFTASCDNTLNTSGNAQYAQETVHNVEDGTGINTPTVVGMNRTVSDGDVVASYNDGNTDRYRVFWNDYDGVWAFEDYTCQPTYGTIVDYVGGNLYASTATCGELQVGTYYGVVVADGYGGTYTNSSNTYSPYGTYVGVCGSMNNWEAWYYSDGNGGMYTGDAPEGFVLSEYSYSNSFNWTAPDGSSGTFTYEYGGSTCVATQNGGQNCNGGGWSANSGDPITSGTYSYGTGTYDDDGNEIYQTEYYSLSYNGGGGYNTNTWT